MSEPGVNASQVSSNMSKMIDHSSGGLSGGNESREEATEAAEVVAERAPVAQWTEEDDEPVEDGSLEERHSYESAEEESLEGNDGFELAEAMVIDALDAADISAFLGRFNGEVTDSSYHPGGNTGRITGGDRRAGRSAQARRTTGDSREPWRLADRLKHFATTEGADESELMEEAAELAGSGRIEPGEAVPILAGLAARKLIRLPMASVPRELRRWLIRAIAAVARDLVRGYGPQAIRAISPIIRTVRRVAASQHTAMRELPRLVQQIGGRVARSPQTVERLSRSSRVAMVSKRWADRRAIPQSLLLRGPVYITIEKSFPTHGRGRLRDDLLNEP